MSNRSSSLAVALTVALFAIVGGGVVTAQDSAAAVYTNEDLNRLPSPGNSTLPTLEGDQPAASQIAGRPLPASPEGSGSAPAASPAVAGAPGVDPLQWLQSRQSQARLDLQIAEARRRVERSVAEAARLQRGFRSGGSAFADRDASGSDGMFVRGVADDSDPYDRALRAAYEEMAAARVALARLLDDRVADDDAIESP